MEKRKRQVELQIARHKCCIIAVFVVNLWYEKHSTIHDANVRPGSSQWRPHIADIGGHTGREDYLDDAPDIFNCILGDHHF